MQKNTQKSEENENDKTAHKKKLRNKQIFLTKKQKRKRNGNILIYNLFVVQFKKKSAAGFHK